MEEEYLFFDHSGFHKSKFKEFNLEAEENAQVKASLFFSLDGAIIGVKPDVIKPYLKLDDVRKMRAGIIKTPNSFEIKTAENFYRMLAIFLPLDVD